jgi:tetratricopeptide (TPR) repeat protein
MGSVYQARDLEVNRVVAIKIIRPELANDPAIVQRFKQELVLARQVTHRNVVRIYDLGFAGGLRFISMEYIDGDELSNVLQERGKFDPKTAAEIVVQVCRGLEAAHSQGVIHRDLKPQNIMLDRQGRAAVMDFGIARSAELSILEELASEETATQEYGLTQVGSLIGTPRYMSPEQAQGQRVDSRSDIYTVGIIFYELLTGRLPFSAPSVKELLRKRGKDRVRPVTELEPKVPKRLNEVVLKCLESRPEDRYQSVSDLILDLEVWLGIRSLPGARRTNRWTALAMAVALLAVTFSAYLVRDHMASNAAKAHRPVTVLIADFQNGTGKPVLSGVVEPMVQVAIEGSSFISAFNRGQEHKLAATIQPGSKSVDEHLGRLIAIREGVGVVVDGAVENHGKGYRLSAKAIEPNGKVLLTETSDFSQLNDLPKAVDKVAEGVRRVLGDSTHSSVNSAAETFTSGSLASAQKYATAQQLQWDGKWEEAVAAYREATVLDPKMSRAYAGMAATLANQGNRQQAAHYYQLALAHIDRESEREKFRTRGGYYLLMRDYQKAAEQFGQLIKEYPVDSAGLANLALAYFYGRNMKAALEEGRKAVKIYPQNILQRNNLGLYAMYAGDFDSAINESEIILKMNPSFEKAYLCLGISQLQRGSVAEAQQTFEKLTTLSKWGASEGALALGDLAIYEGRYSDAIQVLEKGISSDLEQKNAVPASVKLVALADAELGRKQRGAALKSAARAAASNEDESVLYGAARVDVQAGSPADALLLAKRLSNRFEPEPRALSKLIEGEVEMEGGRLHQAVASFQEAQKLADTWIGRYDLGRAYLAAKLYPDAENEFEICVKRRGEASAIFLDDEPTVRYLPAVYYYLGVAKSGLGSAGATEEFRIFLAMKQHSEPDVAVADAKRKVSNP